MAFIGKKVLMMAFLINGIVFPLSAIINSAHLKTLFPLHSFKNAVDVCMRCYTEMLLLEERLASQEKYEEILDLLVGRIMRLNSYIDQIIYDYRYEATICPEEIEYLAQLLGYMEITLDSIRNECIPQALNAMLLELKQKINSARTLRQ